MSRRHYYLLSALPGLLEFGGPPPMGKSRFLGMVRECGGPESEVEALLLGDDLLEREAVISGEIRSKHADLSVLSASQARDAHPLPDFLISEGAGAPASGPAMLPADRIWRRYFSHVTRMARRMKSRFLAEWAAYEVGLRNALVRARAESLNLDPRPYLVAPELGKPAAAFHRELDAWKRAPHPLAGLEALERIRWQWLTDRTPWYDFGDDEVLAYGARLLVLLRWRRMVSDHESDGKGVP